MIATAALVVLMIFGRIAARRFFRKAANPDPHDRCRCGYVVE